MPRFLLASDRRANALEYSAEFVKEVWNEYLGGGTTDFQRGEIFGGIMFEVGALAMPLCKAGQVGQVGKLQFLTQLRGAAFYQRFPRAAAALERVITVLENAGVAGGCFVAGTPVLTDRGIRNIENIQPGDWVLSRDPDTGVQAYKPVTKTFVNHPSRLYHLWYRAREVAEKAQHEAAGCPEQSEAGNPDAELIVTGAHPIFVPSQGRFVEAARLKVGDAMRVNDSRVADLTAVAVEDAPVGQRFTTYNFSVADYHTYFVGDPSIWAHNACPISWKRFVTKLESHYARLRGKGKTPWKAAKEVAEANKSSHFPEAKGRLFAGATKEGIKEVAAGRQPLFIGEEMTIPSHNESTAFYETITKMKGASPTGRLPSYYSDHHLVFKELIEILVENGQLKAGIGPGSSPSMLLPWETEHATLHSVIDPMVRALKNKQGGKRAIKVNEVIAVMQDGYRAAGLNDEATVAVQWLNHVKK